MPRVSFRYFHPYTSQRLPLRISLARDSIDVSHHSIASRIEKQQWSLVVVKFHSYDPSKPGKDPLCFEQPTGVFVLSTVWCICKRRNNYKAIKILSHLESRHSRVDYRTVYRCMLFFSQSIDLSLSYNDVSSDLSKISQRIVVKTRERMILLLVQITVFSPSALSTVGKDRVFHPLGRDRNSRSPRTYRLYKRIPPREEMEHERFRRLSTTRRRFVTDNEWKPRRAYCALYNSLHFSSAKATKRVHKGLRNNRAMSIALLFAKP